MKAILAKEKSKKVIFSLHPGVLEKPNHLYVAWRLIRKFAAFAVDAVVCIFNPHRLVLLNMPPEVYHAKRKQTGSKDKIYSALQDSISTWNSPSILATFCALDIRNQISTPNLIFPLPKKFIFDELRELYDGKSGGFYSSRQSQRTDFESSYYAIRIMETYFRYMKYIDKGSLDKINRIEYFSRLGIDIERTGEYFVNKAETFQARPFDHDNDINLSVLARSLEWRKLVEDATGAQLPAGSLEEKAASHIIRKPEDQAVQKFLLYALDPKSATLDSMAAGLRVLSLFRADERYDVDYIINQCEKGLAKVEKGECISPLLNIYKISVVTDRLFSVAVLSEGVQERATQLSEEMVEIVKILHEDLYFRGGYRLSSASNAMPNLYATRIMVHMLKYYNLIHLANPEEISQFSDDCFSISDRLYRCYPYVSKYYLVAEQD